MNIPSVTMSIGFIYFIYLNLIVQLFTVGQTADIAPPSSTVGL